MPGLGWRSLMKRPGRTCVLTFKETSIKRRYDIASSHPLMVADIPLKQYALKETTPRNGAQTLQKMRLRLRPGSYFASETMRFTRRPSRPNKHPNKDILVSSTTQRRKISADALNASFPHTRPNTFPSMYH